MSSHRFAAVNEINFDSEVLAAKQRYLVEFSAPWCGACKMLLPVLEGVATELEGQLAVGVIDSDQSPTLSNRYSVSALPTLILFENGKEIARHRGTLSRTALRELIGTKTS
ncbi:MAG: thioredoxin domain-containing protein [Polyangiaceae bacterium]